MKWNVNGWRRAGCAAAVLAAALLGACGGGDQVQQFHASRVIAFGDETSVILNTGAKYTDNAVVSGTTTLDCAAHPLWVQKVAHEYGLEFPECGNPQAVSRIFAANGAHVADLAAQIDQQIADGGFRKTDLVTILIGANDIFDQFAQYPGVPEDTLVKNLEQSAAALAAQVNRVADLGAKVLISTVPELGMTPYGRALGTANAKVLSQLTQKFNIEMRTLIYNDGHRIGLVQIDDYLRILRNEAGGGVFVNMTDAVCTVPLPTCTMLTLRAGTDGTHWLWSDDRHLSSGGQARLGDLARDRARNNPF
jgi:lysophospholipase L1-like esterase